jgi:hypothetical protein
MRFWAECCNFIPDDTAPDGSVTKALSGLSTLAHELAELWGGYFSDYLDWQCVWEMEKCHNHCVVGNLHLYECFGSVWMLFDPWSERFSFPGLWRNQWHNRWWDTDRFQALTSGMMNTYLRPSRWMNPYTSHREACLMRPFWCLEILGCILFWC